MPKNQALLSERISISILSSMTDWSEYFVRVCISRCSSSTAKRLISVVQTLLVQVWE